MEDGTSFCKFAVGICVLVVGRIKKTTPANGEIVLDKSELTNNE